MTEQEVISWFTSRDRFLVLTHIRPDGDTLGCATALCLALQAMGKTAYTLPNPGLTPTYEGFLDFQWAPEGYAPDHVVAVDIATENLFPEGEQQKYIGKSALCIDHHPSNTHYARGLCLDASAAACGEIIYRLCKRWGVLSEPIARALYVAISTDCGCFAYSNTTPETHRIAAELLEIVDVRPINKHFFQTKSRKRLQVEAALMASEAFFGDGEICIGRLSLSDRESIGASEQDCEEIAAFAAQIEGVKCAATLKELSPGEWKISLRTDGQKYDANRICGLLGGGGHVAAAGGRVSGTEAQAREAVYDSIMQALDMGRMDVPASGSEV